LLTGCRATTTGMPLPEIQRAWLATAVPVRQGRTDALCPARLASASSAAIGTGYHLAGCRRHSPAHPGVHGCGALRIASAISSAKPLKW
jgi:hypothetical protein